MELVRIIFLIILVLFTGCERKEEFRILSSSPKQGEADVSLDSEIIIFFSKPVRLEDLLYHRNVETNIENPHFTLTGQRKVLHIKNQRLFSEGKEYYVKIKSSLRSEDGSYLKRNFSLFFSTQIKPPFFDVSFQKIINAQNLNNFHLKFVADEKGTASFLINDVPASIIRYEEPFKYIDITFPLLNFYEGENSLYIHFTDEKGRRTSGIYSFFVDSTPPSPVTGIDVTDNGYIKFYPSFDEGYGNSLKYKLAVFSRVNEGFSEHHMCSGSEVQMINGYLIYDVFKNCDGLKYLTQNQNFGKILSYDEAGNFSESATFPIFFYYLNEISYPSGTTIYSLSFCDLNADSYDELLVGFSQGGTGGVDLYPGGSSGIGCYPPSISPFVTYSNQDDMFGLEILCEDADSDGFKDLIVGSPGYDGGRGALFIYSGGYTFPTTYSSIITGQQTGENFGYSLSYGDYDCDGHGEFFVGATSGRGKIYVFEDFTQSPAFTFAPSQGENFGEKIYYFDEGGCGKYFVKGKSGSEKRFYFFNEKQPADEVGFDEEGELTLLKLKLGENLFQPIFAYISESGKVYTFFECFPWGLCSFYYPYNILDDCVIFETINMSGPLFDLRGNRADKPIFSCRNFIFVSSRIFTLFSFYSKENFFIFPHLQVEGFFTEKIKFTSGSVDDDISTDFAAGISNAVYLIRKR